MFFRIKPSVLHTPKFSLLSWRRFIGIPNVNTLNRMPKGFKHRCMNLKNLRGANEWFRSTHEYKLPDLSLNTTKIARILVAFGKTGPNFLDPNFFGGAAIPPRHVRLWFERGHGSISKEIENGSPAQGWRWFYLLLYFIFTLQNF